MTAISRRALTHPHPDRLEPRHPRRDEILAAHAAALWSSEPGYLDPVAHLFVLTAATLVDRGECCDQGRSVVPTLVVPGSRRSSGAMSSWARVAAAGHE